MADTQHTYRLLNIPKRLRFSFVGYLALFQVGFIVCFGYFGKYNYETTNEVPRLYSSKL